MVISYSTKDRRRKRVRIEWKMFVSHLTRQRLSFIFLLNEYTLIQNRRRGNICHGRKRQTSVYGRSAEGRFSMLRPGCLPARDWRVGPFPANPPPGGGGRGLSFVFF